MEMTIKTGIPQEQVTKVVLEPDGTYTPVMD